MKIAVLGRTRHIIHWPEDAVAAFRADGHDARLFATRNPAIAKPLEHLLLSERIGAPKATWMARSLAKFAPDLILVTGADRCPPVILDAIGALPNRPPLVGWVGDTFDSSKAAPLGCFDVVAYTDSGLLALHAQYGVRSRSAFMPHAAPLQRVVAGDQPGARIPLLAFVASRTDNRLRVLQQLRSPIALFGPEWHDRPEVAHHECHIRRVPAEELAAIYTGHLAVLNIRNEKHVLHGLNQRSFAPYVYGAPVVTDPQPDLEQCFEPGREVLVYRDADELAELYAMLRRDPARAAAVGKRGAQRVEADHTYARRLQTFMSLV
jgi:spore maturation protein CgeB